MTIIEYDTHSLLLSAHVEEGRNLRDPHIFPLTSSALPLACPATSCVFPLASPASSDALPLASPVIAFAEPSACLALIPTVDLRFSVACSVELETVSVCAVDQEPKGTRRVHKRGQRVAVSDGGAWDAKVTE